MGIQWQAANRYPNIYPFANNPPPPGGGYPMAPPAMSQPVMPWRQPPMLTAAYTSALGYPVQMFTLSNGHRVVIEQRPTDAISLRTFINTGSINENPLFRSRLYGASLFPSGIAHLDEHCHFLNTRNFPVKNSWVNAMNQDGASINASTASEVVQHEVTFNREDLPRMLAMHAESVLRPTYNPNDIAQEKQNVINEMGQRMNIPENKVHSKLGELLFDRPDFQTLGTEADVLNTSPEQLQQFHQAYYTPTNMVTVISGRVDPNMVLAIANRELGNNPPKIRADYAAATRLALRPGEICHATVHDPQLTYSVVQLGFPAPARTSLRERVSMDFLRMLLGDGPLSLLQSEVQDRQRLVTGLDVGYNPLKATGSFEVSLRTDPGKEQRALAATLNTISQVSQLPMSPQKFAEIRDKLAYGFKGFCNDVEASTNMMGEEALNQSLPYYTHYLQILNSMTPEEVLLAAQKYLNPRNYAVVFGVPGQPSQSGGVA